MTSTSALRSDHINYLTIVDDDGNEQVIETTDTHPFWVVTDEPDLERAARELADGFYHENIDAGLNGYWVEAKDLRVGDVFLGANGELSTLTNLVRVEQDGGIAVFNFTVEGNHNYFILAKEYEFGQTAVLVHNGECLSNSTGLKSNEEVRKWYYERASKIVEQINKLSLSLREKAILAVLKRNQLKKQARAMMADRAAAADQRAIVNSCVWENFSKGRFLVNGKFFCASFFL